jgi:hypothetical protein
MAPGSGHSGPALGLALMFTGAQLGIWKSGSKFDGNQLIGQK